MVFIYILVFISFIKLNNKKHLLKIYFYSIFLSFIYLWIYFYFKDYFIEDLLLYNKYSSNGVLWFLSKIVEIHPLFFPVSIVYMFFERKDWKIFLIPFLLSFVLSIIIFSWNFLLFFYFYSNLISNILIIMHLYIKYLKKFNKLC